MVSTIITVLLEVIIIFLTLLVLIYNDAKATVSKLLVPEYIKAMTQNWSYCTL